MSKISFEQNGNTFDVNGSISGTMPEILDFSENVLLAQINHTYTAVKDTRGIRDGLKKEEVALFVTIQVVRNAFDSFMEEHEGETESAFAMCRDFEKFRAEMEG